MSKYFKYAFGEIILVVIGILIALQINNWNQKRLDKNFEIIMLKEVKKGLESDLFTHQFLTRRSEVKEKAIQDLLQMIKSNKNYPDSTLLKTYI